MQRNGTGPDRVDASRNTASPTPMPTTKPRLQVTLTPRSRDAIARVAAVQGRPASKIVAEVLDEATPVLEQLANTMEALKDAAASIKGSVVRRLSTAERRAYTAAVEGMALLAELEQDARDVEAGGIGAAGATRRPLPDPRPSNTGVTPPILGKNTAPPAAHAAARRKKK